MRHVLSIAFLISFSFPVFAQYEWQNPLDFGPVDLGNKFALLYNLAGVGASAHFGKNKDFKGYWQTSLYAEFHQEYDPKTSKTDVFMGKARLGRQLHKWLQLGGEVLIYKFRNDEVSTAGLGGALYFNWYFINKKRFKFYFDNGAGLIGTAENFPEGGTKFNFSNFYGLSGSFLVQPATYLKIGVRNMHISNAFLFGDDRNPAFDSIGFLVGFEFGGK